MKNKIIVVGLGPGSHEYLTIKAVNILKEYSGSLYLRTKIHPTVEYLNRLNLKYETFDELYETERDFDVLYNKIADKLADMAEEKPICYAVPGSPLVAEKTVDLLMQKGANVEIIAGISFLELIYERLYLDPIEGLDIFDAFTFTKYDINPGRNTILSQVYNKMIASDVKLKLMEIYGDEHEIIILKSLGNLDESMRTIPLYELDRQSDIDHLTSIFVKKADIYCRNGYNMQDLLYIINILRHPGGCPWDIEQTRETLIPQFLEEAYEFLDAVQNDDIENMIEEAGDVLLHMVFHADMGQDNNEFDFMDITTEICKKMIRRHPHVFSDTKVKSAEEVLKNWDDIKKTEKNKTDIASSLEDIPDALPQLMRAEKIQNKARKAGFDWDDISDACNKVKEELGETMEAHEGGNNDRILMELGDLLFSVVNLSRFLGVRPEMALKASSDKFIKRFKEMEQKIKEDGKTISDLSLDELDTYWENVKKNK